MNVLMVVSWYSPKDAEVLTAGVFHYEQSMALKPYCNTALYYPYGTDLTVPFHRGVERDLLTYRRKMFTTKIPKLGGLIQRRRMFSDLKRICKEFKPDVIHAHCALPAGEVVTRFGKKYGYPVVITEHSPLEQMPLDKKRIYRKFDRAYGNSDANVCVSKDSMERLREKFPSRSFQVIYNGIISPDSLPKDGVRYAVKDKINCCIVAAFTARRLRAISF